VAHLGSQSETPLRIASLQGSALMRQRVLAAVGCLNSAASAWRRQRRSARPITPESSAARSCHGEVGNFRDDRAELGVWAVYVPLRVGGKIVLPEPPAHCG